MNPRKEVSPLADDFAELFAQYYSPIYSYILSLSHDAALSEEVTQETFVKAMSAIGKFRGQCSLRVWLCEIAKNTYFTLLKKRRRQAPPPEEDWPDSTDLEERFSDKEMALAVHRALHQLEEPYREVFWLRALGELSFAQIAGLFSKTESWARVTYHRARQKLRARLEQEGWGDDSSGKETET